MVVLELLGMAVVATPKVADVADAATVTEAGTVSVALVFDSVIVAPPAGAALVRPTVQVLDAFGPKLVGLHDTEETSGGATRVTTVLAELLLYVAVIVELELLPMVAVVTLKVAEVAVAATVAEAGTVKAELVSESVTLAPRPEQPESRSPCRCSTNSARGWRGCTIRRRPEQMR